MSQKLRNRIIQRQSKMSNDKEIPKDRYMFAEERKKIIDALRLT